MQKVITYVADDDTEFETAEECLAYEASLKSKDGIIFLSDTMNVLDDELGVVAERAEYLKIIDPTAAAKTLRTINQYYGYCCYGSLHTSCLNAGDVWVYDGCDYFYNLKAKIDDLTALLTKIEKGCENA